MGKCEAWITIGDGPRIQCGLDHPHPTNVPPDIHAARLIGFDSEDRTSSILLEWPLRHINLEGYAAAPAVWTRIGDGRRHE